jgi:putative transposase
VGRTPGPQPPPGRLFWRENSLELRDYIAVEFYRRRLPHISTHEHSVFLTWRLYDSLPIHRVFPADAMSSGEAFAAMDRLLDETRTGTFHLRQPAIADMVVEAIHYNCDVLRHYLLHAFVVMPNHVHLLCAPTVELQKLTRSLKGLTAKRANALLGMTGKPFWQEESYDRLVRNGVEFDRIRNYIENNPVRAGLVRVTSEFKWSSAAGATGGRPRTRGSAPQQIATWIAKKTGL